MMLYSTFPRRDVMLISARLSIELYTTLIFLFTLYID